MATGTEHFSSTINAGGGQFDVFGSTSIPVCNPSVEESKTYYYGRSEPTTSSSTTTTTKTTYARQKHHVSLDISSQINNDARNSLKRRKVHINLQDNLQCTTRVNAHRQGRTALRSTNIDWCRLSLGGVCLNKFGNKCAPCVCADRHLMGVDTPLKKHRPVWAFSRSGLSEQVWSQVCTTCLRFDRHLMDVDTPLKKHRRVWAFSRRGLPEQV